MLNNRLSVSAGNIVTRQQLPSSLTAGKKQITANLASSMSGIGGVSSIAAYGAPSFSTFLQGFVPDQVEQSLVPHYREIYYYDSVGGSAVDLKSHFPFSDFTLVGLDSKDLFPFSESMSRLNMQTLFQEISTAYLVDSAFVGSLIFDSDSKAFKDVLMHDYLSASFTTRPFHSLDPMISVNSSYNLQNFLNSDSPYKDFLLAGYPKSLLDRYSAGSVTLDPLTTLYVPRRVGSRDRLSVSYLKRILPVYLLDKILYRGTLMEAHKRQRATTHIMAGDENWIPNDSELQGILEDFQRTDLDPLGAWIATRNGIQVSDVRQGGDFWKWTDTFDIMTPFKLRALGISEAFLSGDASYSTAEAALTLFQDEAEAHRQHLTYSVLTNKIFPIIAILHGMYRVPSEAGSNDTAEGLMKNLSNQRNLKLPTVRWHKSLEGKDAASQWDMLEKLSEKGFSVPMKMFAAAAGIDITTLLSELNEDADIRKSMQEAAEKIKSQTPSTEPEESESVEFSALPRMVSSPIKRKPPLLSREVDQSKPIGVLSKSGKVVHAVPNERSHQTKINNNLVKAMQALADPNHKESVRKKLREKGLN
jgi:hypothetical protein